MSTTVTLRDDIYSQNDATGKKRLFVTISCTNPYTANGELVDCSTYFDTVEAVNIVGVGPSVSATLSGLASTAKAKFVPGTSTSFLLQMFNVSIVPGNGWIDNSTANISNLTIYAELIGR